MTDAEWAAVRPGDARGLSRLGRAYAFFRRWREQGLITEFHDRMRGKVREREGREAEPAAGIIDAQSVRAAATLPAASRGCDGGKKVPGRKRHIVTDTLGLLLVIRSPPRTPATGTPRQDC
ncbi:transposase [Streptomyces goshikiensis]